MTTPQFTAKNPNDAFLEAKNRFERLSSRIGKGASVQVGCVGQLSETSLGYNIFLKVRHTQSFSHKTESGEVNDFRKHEVMVAGQEYTLAQNPSQGMAPIEIQNILEADVQGTIIILDSPENIKRWKAIQEQIDEENKDNKKKRAILEKIQNRNLSILSGEDVSKDK